MAKKYYENLYDIHNSKNKKHDDIFSLIPEKIRKDKNSFDISTKRDEIESNPNEEISKNIQHSFKVNEITKPYPSENIFEITSEKIPCKKLLYIENESKRIMALTKRKKTLLKLLAKFCNQYNLEFGVIISNKKGHRYKMFSRKIKHYYYKNVDEFDDILGIPYGTPVSYLMNDKDEIEKDLPEMYSYKRFKK